MTPKASQGTSLPTATPNVPALPGTVQISRAALFRFRARSHKCLRRACGATLTATNRRRGETIDISLMGVFFRVRAPRPAPVQRP